MCGFLGVNKSIEKKYIDDILDILKSRGPDQNGIHCDSRFTLISCRLSIVGPASFSGPYFNEDKSLAIVFNGELYNYLEIKKDLENSGHVFKTTTDAEVVLHAYESKGEKCLDDFNGQFAFAIYHLNENKVFLARDRFGIKPLYYYKNQGDFLFSSSVLALNSLDIVKKELNPNALKKYLAYRYNDLDETFFKNIFKLPPASFAFFENDNLTISKYYSLPKRVADCKISKQDAADKFRTLLENSVDHRIPEGMDTGILLSGGIDSASILSVLSSCSDRINAYTFSIGNKFDESNDAVQIAKQFAADINIVKSPSDSYMMLDKIVENLSEPIGDAILIPMGYLFEEAAKKQKVILSGEGADEVLGGYIHQQLFYKLSRFPKITKLAPFIADIIKVVPLKILNMFFNYPEKLQQADRNKIMKMLKNAPNFNLLRAALVTLSDIDFKGLSLQRTIKIADYFTAEIETLINQGWLSDYTLSKLDGVSMAFSTEGRVPFLDHELVDFVSTLPAKHLISLKRNKMVLREAFKFDLSSEIVKRPKKAFYFPYADIFDFRFRDWAYSYMDKVKDDSRINTYIDFMDLQNMLDNIKLLSLCESKKLMNILVFIVWFVKNFKR